MKFWQKVMSTTTKRPSWEVEPYTKEAQVQETIGVMFKNILGRSDRENWY